MDSKEDVMREPISNSRDFNFMLHIMNTCSLFINNYCCKEGLWNMESECVKMLITKGLGYAIIVASTMVKLPQLMKLTSAKSSCGLSFMGAFLELLAVSFNASYSKAKLFPFSAWGEALFLTIETALIAFSILWYDRKQSKASAFMFVYIGALSVLLSGMVPLNILWFFQTLNLPLAVGGKMIQALKNFNNQHTGQLSALTVTLLCSGCIARIFTSIQETGDPVVIWTYVAASIANSVLVAQVFYYWNKTNIFLTKQAGKKEL